MRLTVAVETARLVILNGPGATKLLDASLRLSEIGGRVHAGASGPMVEFTVENPVAGTPMKVFVEVTGGFRKMSDNHYEMNVVVNGWRQALHVSYYLADVGYGRGEITDLP